MECEESRQVWNWQLTQNNGVTHSLPCGLIFIGCEGCDIILQSPGIEKRHAVLSYNTDQAEFYIKDLNSLTGTYVNGKRIPEQLYIKLNPKDSIRLGYGPVFTLTQTEEAPNHRTEQPHLEQPHFPKPEETSLHDSLEDICETHTQLAEKRVIPSPLVATCNPNEILKEVESPNKVMLFPSPTRSLNIGAKNSFEDIAVINKMPSSSLPKEDATSPVINNNNNNKIVESSPTTQDSKTPDTSQLSAMAFTIPFDLEMPKKKIRPRESLSRFASSKSDSENGHSYRSPILSNRKDDRSFSERLNGTSRELPSPPNTNHNGPNRSPMNDTTSYLIHKMLGGDATEQSYAVPKTNMFSKILPVERRKPSPSSSSGDKNSPAGEQRSLTHSPSSPIKTTPREKDADEKSETGTYTVETEQTDPDVDEARKKIDEVFGVYKPSEKVSSRQNSKESNGVPFSQHRSHNGSDMSDRDSGSSREPAPVTRPKRRLPTPPVEKVNLNFDVNSARESVYPTVCVKGRRGDTFIQDYAIAKPPLPNSYPVSQPLAPKPPPRFYSSKSQFEQKSEPLSPFQRTDQRSVHRQSSAGSHPDSGTCGSLSDSGSARQFYGSPWRRMSWNRSCSDLELDQSKSDSASVVSDISTSTEPSSHSSGRSKNEVGPQMRLNRAFALRRARLGFETEDLQPAARNASKDGKAMPRAGANSAASSLSRQDGGRFSLRLPRSTTVRLSKVNKPQENKFVRQPQAWSSAPPKPEPQKVPRPVSARPSREVSIKKTRSLRSLNTPLEPRCANKPRNNDLQKSASFAASGDLKTQKPPVARKAINAKRPVSATAIAHKAKATTATAAANTSKKIDQVCG